MMSIAAQNPSKYLDQFSKTVSHCHCQTPIAAAVASLTHCSHCCHYSCVAVLPSSLASSAFPVFILQFEQGFLKLLSRRFGERRVHANIVYNEFIKDKHHVHMNATQWESLTSFVKYLAQTNQCKIDETEKVRKEGRLLCCAIALLAPPPCGRAGSLNTLIEAPRL